MLELNIKESINTVRIPYFSVRKLVLQRLLMMIPQFTLSCLVSHQILSPLSSTATEALTWPG